MLDERSRQALTRSGLLKAAEHLEAECEAIGAVAATMTCSFESPDTEDAANYTADIIVKVRKRE
jgi:hypothetical protein